MFEAECKLLGFEEGYRDHVYLDSEGYPTAGKGTRISWVKMTEEEMQRIFKHLYVSEKTADSFLFDELQRNEYQLAKFEWFERLDETRKIIIRSMAYQLGVNGVRGFKNMIKGIKRQNWQQAHDEALDSLWHNKQTPGRAERHAMVLLTGDFSSVPQYENF